MKYLIVIERAEKNFSAYLPDLPGCVATGKTRDEVVRRIVKAADMHIKGLEEDGFPIPEPKTTAEYLNFELAS